MLQPSGSWRPARVTAAAWLALLLAVTGLAYAPTLAYVLAFWNDIDSGEYAHGYLVLAICLYILWRKRDRLASLPVRPDWRASGLLTAAVILWLLAALTDVQVLQAVALLPLLLALVWLLLGWRQAREYIFPVLFLAFAIPVWFPLSAVLQDLTADAVFVVTRSLQIPAIRSENMIVLPAGTLAVEEACSGLRYFLAALILGVLYAWLNYRSLRARLVVVLCAAAAGALANILRVLMIVYLGYTTDMRHPLIYDHLMPGWYLFGALVALLLLADTLVYRYWIKPRQPDVVEQAAPAPEESAASARQFAGAALAGLLLLAAGPALLQAARSGADQPGAGWRVVLPPLPGWQGPLATQDDWQPVYHGALSAQAEYVSQGNTIVLYVGYYAAQQQGRELITYHNRISGKGDWQPRYTRARLRQFDDLSVLEQQLGNHRERMRQVWYWYNVAGIDVTSRYAAKALQVWGMLTGNRHAYVVALAAESELANSDQHMLAFARQIKTHIEAAGIVSLLQPSNRRNESI